MKKVCISIGLIISIVTVVGWQFARLQQVNKTTVLHPTASIYFANGESIEIELYPEYAPNTVNNFIYLATQGFYVNSQVNQIIPQELVQLGDHLGNGYGYPGYFIESECRYNGYNNKLSHSKGTVSMARSTSFNTEGSQFFILLEDNPSLNGQYAAFGRVTKGMEVLETIGTLQVRDLKTIENYRIASIQIDTMGIAFEEPTILTLEEQQALNER